MNNYPTQRANSSVVTEFVLLGLTEVPALKLLLFSIFLLIYCTAVMANVGVILAIWIEPRLHTPMYFFVSHLSANDFFLISIIVPSTLANFTRRRRSISILGCSIQMLLFGTTATTESYILAVMAYDRLVAIRMPLLYATIMSKALCDLLAAGAYIAGFLNSLIQTCFTFRLTYCKSVIDHFYCDIPPIVKLSCSDLSANKVVIFLFGGFASVSCLSIILYSYINIVATISNIRSEKGRRKAFSTCASHLTCVSLFYGTVMSVYLRTPSAYMQSNNKFLSVIYTVLIPLINPMIYSLKNNEMKGAMRKIVRKYCLYI